MKVISFIGFCCLLTSTFLFWGIMLLLYELANNYFFLSKDRYYIKNMEMYYHRMSVIKC